jgi:hypothetical protein
VVVEAVVHETETWKFSQLVTELMHQEMVVPEVLEL